MSVEKYGIALDLGTSGVRGQAVDLRNKEILSTAITTQHPLPGGNVMDHLHFAVETSSAGRSSITHTLMLDTVNKVIDALGVPRAPCRAGGHLRQPHPAVAVPGHGDPRPRLRGESKRASLGVEVQSREARIITVGDIEGLDLPSGAELVVPPAVRHEVGADALAMMLKAGMLTVTRSSWSPTMAPMPRWPSRSAIAW